MRASYRTHLRARGVKPLRGPLRTLRADGDAELIPGGGLGIWTGGKLVVQQRRA